MHEIVRLTHERWNMNYIACLAWADRNYTEVINVFMVLTDFSVNSDLPPGWNTGETMTQTSSHTSAALLQFSYHFSVRNLVWMIVSIVELRNIVLWKSKHVESNSNSSPARHDQRRTSCRRRFSRKQFGATRCGLQVELRNVERVSDAIDRKFIRVLSWTTWLRMQTFSLVEKRI
jgi:hypothetical protein